MEKDWGMGERAKHEKRHWRAQKREENNGRNSH